MTEQLGHVVEIAMNGQWTEIRDMFAPPLQAMVSPDALKAAWTAELDKHGQITAVGTPVREQDDIRIPITFDQGELTVVVSADAAGRLTGIRLVPTVDEQWEPPTYATISEFEEQEVLLGTGPLAVGGTLSVPHQPTPCPAIVLLAGSGPLDRNETIGRNKPFKDLAWGLASRGIAVLRFDKVTHAHPDLLTREFTARDEYVPDARAAVALLRAHKSIDPKQIFLLGHSLGGSMAPQVADEDPTIAGLVILAGGTQPLHWAAVRQVKYLASQSPDPDAARPVIEAMTAQAKMVDSPDLSPSTPDSELPFNTPAPYWLSLRGYQPAELAAKLAKPTLILQGARDYQATVTDDLPAWRNGCPDAEVHIYEAANHMFFSGKGPSTPAEYERVQHVDPAVIADIANWLTTPATPGEATHQRTQHHPE